MRTIFFFVLSLCLLVSCKSDSFKLPSHPAIYGLASPIYLLDDTTRIYWRDYVKKPEKVRDVILSDNIKMIADKDGESFCLLTSPDTPYLGNLSFHYKGYKYDIPLLKRAASIAEGESLRITTGRLQGDTVFLRSNRPVTTWAVYIQNCKLNDKSVLPMGRQVGIVIPQEARKQEHSVLRFWAADGTGISNDILIPLKKGEVITRTANLERFDERAYVAYSLLIDRFYDDSEPGMKRSRSMGGNIAGVIKKLNEGYFERLGINSIWLSSMVLNAAGAIHAGEETEVYHGDWPGFSVVSDRLGTEEELKELIKQAHEQDISVVWDCSFKPVNEKLTRGKGNEKNVVGVPTTGALSNVMEEVADSVLFWLENYELDGLKYSAVSDISPVCWRVIDQRLRKELLVPGDRNLYQIADGLTDRKVAACHLSAGGMDGLVDHSVNAAAATVFVLPGQGFDRLNNSLLETFRYYGIHNRMGNVSGDQEKPRFISYAARDTRWVLEAGDSNRKIGERKPSDLVAYQKLLQLLAFNVTIPGIPVIHYGDEIGMSGGMPPDNSRMMRFEDIDGNEQILLGKSSALNHLRNNHMALIYGDFIPVRVEPDIYAYVRCYFGKQVMVVFNKGDEDLVLRLELPVQPSLGKFNSLFEGRFSYDNSSLIVDVPANGVEVIYN